MKREPLVAVVVVHWGSPALTEDCLRSLDECGYPNLRVIVIDNCVDRRLWADSADVPESVFYHQCEENLGFCGGNNLGIREALGMETDYVLLLNNDAEVAPDYLERSVAYLEEHRDVAALNPKILYYHAPEFINMAGGEMDPETGEMRIFGEDERDTGQCDHDKDITWANGCVLLARADVFRQVGLFDERLFCYGEDSDLSRRMVLAGMKIYYLPQTVAYHKHLSPAIGGEACLRGRSVLYYIWRNRVYCFRRYAPVRRYGAGVRMAGGFFVDVARGLKHSGQRGQAFAMLLGATDGLLGRMGKRGYRFLRGGKTRARDLPALEERSGMGNVDVSVVVCTFNRSVRLAQALESLLAQETEGRLTYEIVAVDDGSTDDTPEVLDGFAGRDGPVSVRWVRNEGSGVSAARNTGVREAKGAWIAFFDDDQRAEPQWLRELHQVAMQQEADCVGGTLLLDLAEPAGFTLQSRCRDLLCERDMGAEPMAYPQGHFPATNNVIIRRDLFTRIGLFDSRVDGTEDTDFFKRASETNAAIWYSPRAVAYHLIPKSRLEVGFFKHAALRSGITEAQIRYRYHGWMSCLVGVPRPILRAALRDVWLLAASAIRRDPGGVLERKCRLWETVGQLRGSLAYLAPWLAPQTEFFEKLNFRKRGTGRVRGPVETLAEPAETRC